MISFIIPAFNEGPILGNTLQSIQDFGPKEEVEVVVVDNCSTDNTVGVAMSYGAKVISSNANTIASVRNSGVKESTGDILIFVDSDVLLTLEWSKNIAQLVKRIRSTPLIVSGSRCHPPSNGAYLNKFWYELLNSQKTNYINSGHMITSIRLFELINGFNQSLKTAEDYDFCLRAQKNGANIEPDFTLITVHNGYPDTIINFIKRERWHGREDYETLASFVNSKIALIAMLNLFLFIGSLFLTLTTFSIIPMGCYFISMFFLCITLSTVKFGKLSPFNLVNNSLLHYLYFWGRGVAFLDRIFGYYGKRFRG
jgi:glycosyltransferase involved in cell wall biosynthesis